VEDGRQGAVGVLHSPGVEHVSRHCRLTESLISRGAAVRKMLGAVGIECNDPLRRDWDPRWHRVGVRMRQRDESDLGMARAVLGGLDPGVGRVRRSSCQGWM
jgi:hypothetical protein